MMNKTTEEIAFVSLVMGNIIGPGVFLIPISLAKYGFISLFGFLFSFIGALLIAAVLTHLSGGKDAVFYGLLFFMAFFGVYAMYQLKEKTA